MNVYNIAAKANAIAYNKQSDTDFIDGSPHLKHDSLKKLYAGIIEETMAILSSRPVNVLDLGAGDGSQTLLFLMLGCRVTAVDISKRQMTRLSKKCNQWMDQLTLFCGDVNEIHANLKNKYDIIVINAFLHHIPDYCKVLKHASLLLNENGYIITFQDPLLYSSLSSFDIICSKYFYYIWRLTKGDLLAGLKRFLRRKNKDYSKPQEDDVEYHVVRNGVNQDRIAKLFTKNNFDVKVIKYFSTQISLLQKLGEVFNAKNTFGIVAKNMNLEIVNKE